MDEINETPKNKCQYCGKEYKNVPVHERFCKENPALSQTQKIQHEKEKEQPKEPQQEQKPLIISDVQQVVTDDDWDLPWFEDANGNRNPEVPRFIGIFENIPCYLVSDAIGRLLPVYLIQGFIGMFPKYHEFPVVKQEPHPKEETPLNASGEPIISPQEADNINQVITPEPIHAQEERKQSLLGRILGKKEKATTEKTTSSADLAKRIVDASKGDAI